MSKAVKNAYSDEFYKAKATGEKLLVLPQVVLDGPNENLDHPINHFNYRMKLSRTSPFVAVQSLYTVSWIDIICTVVEKMKKQYLNAGQTIMFLMGNLFILPLMTFQYSFYHDLEFIHTVNACL